ncbi:MAG: choice-of-anchor V domain-containing protein [Flavobacteriales bacterium]
MKLRSLIFLILSAFSLPFLLAYDDGVAEHQNRDRTGAPGSSAVCGASCHDDQSFLPTLTIQLIDISSSQAVSEYIAGETYQIKYIISSESTPSVYGFQSTALHTNNSNAGVFQNPGLDVQLEDVDGRHIIEHSIDSPSNIFTAEWVAPASDAGNVIFYATSVAANNNGANSGDGFAGATLQVSEAATSIEEKALPSILLEMNNKILTIKNLTKGNVVLSDMNGRILREFQVSSTSKSIDLSDQPKGVYVVSLLNGKERSSKKFALN